MYPSCSDLKGSSSTDEVAQLDLPLVELDQF